MEDKEKLKEELIMQIARELLLLDYCNFEFISNLQDKLIRLQSSEIANLKFKLIERRNKRYK